MNKKDLIGNLYNEAMAYRNIDDLEKLIDSESGTFENVPVQPLHAALKSNGPELVSSHLDKLTKEQRLAVMDIDVWSKDKAVAEDFEYWLTAYDHNPSLDLKREFAQSTQFALFLKGHFNIHTFDAEDPMYPEGNNYFLTEDNLLLVEYEPDYRFVDELKRAIRVLYSELGVENAYAYLFKIVSDSFIQLEEDEYRLKKHRLNDLGMIDYYDALELTAPFATRGQIKQFIKSKTKVVSSLEANLKNQILPVATIQSYREGMDLVTAELDKTSDDRLNFLQFTFVQVVNATLSLTGEKESSSTQLTRIARDSKTKMNLAVDYIKSITEVEGAILDYFDFKDLYKIGESLYSIERRKLKRLLINNGVDSADKEEFLGQYWTSLLDGVFHAPCRYYDALNKNFVNVDSLEVYNQWTKNIELFVAFLPFAAQFMKTYELMKEEGLVQSEFYMNYDVEDIDLDSILLSSLINFDLGNFETENSKMAVTISELKKFMKKIAAEDEQTLKPQAELSVVINDFTTKFGLGEVKNVEEYFYALLAEHLEGYEFSTMAEDEFVHVGGPIIFNQQNQKQ